MKLKISQVTLSEMLKFQYDSLKPNRFASDPIFDPWRDSKGSFIKAAS